jgi:hypothetical protein
MSSALILHLDSNPEVWLLLFTRNGKGIIVKAVLQGQRWYSHAWLLPLRRDLVHAFWDSIHHSPLSLHKLQEIIQIIVPSKQHL